MAEGTPQEGAEVRIGMVLGSSFPPDIRVEKEAASLLAAGHTVFLLAQRRSSEEAQQEIVDGIHVVRARTKRLMFWGTRKLNSLFFYLTFVDRLWHPKIAAFVDAQRIDVLHVHDLPLLRTCLKVAAPRSIPVVSDLHENHPEAVHAFGRISVRQRLLSPLKYNPRHWRRYEERATRLADRLIVVVEEAAERFLAAGIPKERIAVVPNTVDLERLASVTFERSIIDAYEGHFVIGYVGGIGPHRGIDCAVAALPYLRERIPSLKLLLVGGLQRAYERKLAHLVERLGVTDRVEFVPWQSFDRAMSYVLASDVCLVAHTKNGHTDTTVPHKLFQYMGLERPVLVSDCAPLLRIVCETDCGRVFRSDDPRSLANRIIELAEDVALRRRLAGNGKAAVGEKYNWRKTSGPLLDLYRGLVR